MKILICLFFLLTSCATWTTGDTVRESSWVVINTIDWGQTLEMAKNPNEFKEHNPILGNHPSQGRVNVYMASSTLAHIGVSSLLPQNIRPWWQYITIGFSGACVINNLRAGIGVSF